MQSTSTSVDYDYRQSYDWSEENTNMTSDDLVKNIVDIVSNDGHRLTIWVLSILMIISAVCNFTVLKLLMARRDKSSSRVDAMLIQLALADLLVALLTMPIEIGWAFTVRWIAGDAMCRLISFFRTFGLYLSSFVMVCISLDRYFAVTQPMKFPGIDRRGKVMIMIAWLAAFVCSTPQAIIFHVEHHPNVAAYTQCVTYHFFPNKSTEFMYWFLIMIGMYALPLSIIIFCYASIYRVLLLKSRKCLSDLDRFRRSNDDVLSRAKKKTFWMTTTIVIVFVLCWTPYYVMSTWFWVDNESATRLDPRVSRALLLFAYTNSCMNPILYGLFNIPRRSDKNNLVPPFAPITRHRLPVENFQCMAVG